MNIDQFLKRASEILRTLAQEKGYAQDQLFSIARPFLQEQASKFGLTLTDQHFELFERIYIESNQNDSHLDPSNQQQSAAKSKVKVLSSSKNEASQETQEMTIEKAISLEWAIRAEETSAGSFSSFLSKIAAGKKSI